MIRRGDLIAYVGGAAFQQFGVDMRRRQTAQRGGESQLGAWSHTGADTYAMGRDGTFHKVAADTSVVHWVDADGDGILDTCTLVPQPAVTNEVIETTPDNDGVEWSNDTLFTLTAKTALIQGTTPYEHDDASGGDFRQDLFGTFDSADSYNIVWGLMESGDATTSRLGFVNGVSGEEQYCELTWATGATAVVGGTWSDGAGTAFARKVLEVGPNGVPLYQFGIYVPVGSAANGDGRHVRIYPAMNAGGATIVHHIQVTENRFLSLPVVGSGPLARARDAATFPLVHAPEAMTVYLKLINYGSNFTGSTRLFNVGGSVGNKRIRFTGAGTDQYGFNHSTTVTNVGATPAGTPALFDAVELLGRVNSDGSVQCLISINGTAPNTSGTSSALAFDKPLGWSNALITLGSNGAAAQDAPGEYIACILARGAQHDFNAFREWLP